MNEPKRLYRTENDQRKLAGVCGGVAEYLNSDPRLIRLLTVLLCLCASVGLWLYIAAALIVPNKSSVYPEA